MKWINLVGIKVQPLLPQASFGFRVLSLPASVRPSVRHQVCPRDNSTPVQARLTKFGQNMQNTSLMVPTVFFFFCFFFFFFGGGGGQSTLTFKVKFNFKVKIYPILSLSTPLTHHPFKLGLRNLDQGCKIHRIRSSLFLKAINLDFQGQIWLKKSDFLVSTLLEIHNHHITTREPWVPRLLHMPDCFMVSISAHIYIPRLFHGPDCFTVSKLCMYIDLGSRWYFGF